MRSTEIQPVPKRIRYSGKSPVSEQRFPAGNPGSSLEDSGPRAPSAGHRALLQPLLGPLLPRPLCRSFVSCFLLSSSSSFVVVVCLFLK